MRAEDEQQTRTEGKGECDWDNKPENQNVMTLLLYHPRFPHWAYR